MLIVLFLMADAGMSIIGIIFYSPIILAWHFSQEDGSTLWIVAGMFLVFSIISITQNFFTTINNLKVINIKSDSSIVTQQDLENLLDSLHENLVGEYSKRKDMTFL